MFNIGLKQEVKPVLLDGRGPALAIGESVISICTAHCLQEEQHRQVKVISPFPPTTVPLFLNLPTSFRIYFESIVLSCIRRPRMLAPICVEVESLMKLPLIRYEP